MDKETLRSLQNEGIDQRALEGLALYRQQAGRPAFRESGVVGQAQYLTGRTTGFLFDKAKRAIGALSFVQRMPEREVAVRVRRSLDPNHFGATQYSLASNEPGRAVLKRPVSDRIVGVDVVSEYTIEVPVFVEPEILGGAEIKFDSVLLRAQNMNPVKIVKNYGDSGTGAMKAAITQQVNSTITEAFANPRFQEAIGSIIDQDLSRGTRVNKAGLGRDITGYVHGYIHAALGSEIGIKTKGIAMEFDLPPALKELGEAAIKTKILMINAQGQEAMTQATVKPIAEAVMPLVVAVTEMISANREQTKTIQEGKIISGK